MTSEAGDGLGPVGAAAGSRGTLLHERRPGWDEMSDSAGAVRDPWREVGAMLDHLGLLGLAQRRRTVERLLADDGAGYRIGGSDIERPWSLDPIPMLLEHRQWRELELGLTQRAELLDEILTDLYGERTLLTSGLLPPEVVLGHPGFVREVDRIRLPGPRQLFLSSADLARDADGRWTVLTDRTQAPSGAGYAMENRRVISRAMPGLHRNTSLHRVMPFFHAMRQSLQQVAPEAGEVPRVVLLTPGAHSETAFDQAFLSSLLGFPLVEGSDLTVRDGRLWQHSIDRLEPVDVVLRRVDSWFCDPLELRADSRLGVPGLVEAARLGTVSVVNGIGTGVLENPALFPFLPALCERLLGAPLRLPSAATWWCGDPLSRRHALANLHRLVFKPSARAVGHASQFGWELSASAREDLARRIEAEPHAWVAQEPLELSTAPTAAADGVQSRPLVLRTFAVAQAGSYLVMPGGLVRVAPDADTTVISNQQGAISKDLWVLTDSHAPDTPEVIPDGPSPVAVATAIPPRVAEDLFWLGRYAERAEDVARLLRVTDNVWADVHPQGDPALARCLVVLLEALTSVTTTWPGFVGTDAGSRLAAPRAELLSLIGADRREGTLAHGVRRMRELANAVRDQLSGDTWTVLAGLDRRLAPFVAAVPAGTPDAAAALDGSAPAPDNIAETLSQVLESLLAFAGLAAESMVRDAGWYFMDSGRRLERALGVAGLLRAALTAVHPPEVETLMLETVLLASESIITHRRRYPSRRGIETVLELLISDRGNPRSVAYQLDRLGSDLAQIPGTGATHDLMRRRVLDIVTRVREADAADLAAATDGRRPRLVDFLSHVERQLRELSGALEATHFAPPAPLQPLESFSLDPAGADRP